MSNLIELRKIMLEHQKADQLVQGAWWDSEEKKGCFYGCAVHENDEYAIEKAIQKFGIEPWIAYWSEQVFEGLPQKLALNWPVELLDAMIQFDVDYKDIFHKLSIKRLENLPNTNDENVNEAIKKVVEYHLNPTEDKRKEALSAAEFGGTFGRMGGIFGGTFGGRFGGRIFDTFGGTFGTFGGTFGKFGSIFGGTFGGRIGGRIFDTFGGTFGTFGSKFGGIFGCTFTTLEKRTKMDA